MPRNLDIASARASTRPDESARTGTVIWGQFLLRLASSAGVLVVGGYFVYLHDQGQPVSSLLLGGVSALVYVTELVLAPVAGSLSDRRGRRAFLVAGPALAAIAVLLIPLGVVSITALPIAVTVGIVVIARLIEGAGAALSAPATLGFLAETTDDQPLVRGRSMSFFELASAIGIAGGAVVGPLLWNRFHFVGFVLLAGTYACAAIVMLRVHDRPNSHSVGIGFSIRQFIGILSYRPLTLFLPTWIAANAILGVWVNAQIEFVLAAKLHVSGQHFVGSLHGRVGTLSEILGLYVLWFAICVVVWSQVLGHVSKVPTLFVTLSGSVVASIGLLALNHGLRPIAFIPFVLVGIFLEAGFTPTALAYLADISQRFAHDRGLLMGLYSVMLGVGQLAGAVLGGIFAQLDYFDGLTYLTVILAVVGATSLLLLLNFARLEGGMGTGAYRASHMGTHGTS